jgi:hypothetical protein
VVLGLLSLLLLGTLLFGGSPPGPPARPVGAQVALLSLACQFNETTHVPTFLFQFLGPVDTLTLSGTYTIEGQPTVTLTNVPINQPFAAGGFASAIFGPFTGAPFAAIHIEGARRDGVPVTGDADCAGNASPTPTATQTSTVTPTLMPSSTPTITLTPTETLTPTITPTPQHNQRIFLICTVAQDQVTGEFRSFVTIDLFSDIVETYTGTVTVSPEGPTRFPVRSTAPPVSRNWGTLPSSRPPRAPTGSMTAAPR